MRRRRFPSTALAALLVLAQACGLPNLKEERRQASALPQTSFLYAADGSLITALHAGGRPVYLLADSEEMAAPLAALGACCQIIPIAELYLPYYYQSGAAANQLIPLYRIEFSP